MPFNKMEEVPMERIDLVHSSHFSLKPLNFITWRIASCSIVSNAFAKSRIRIIIGFFEAYYK
jgi:hypothetical protein